VIPRARLAMACAMARRAAGRRCATLAAALLLGAAGFVLPSLQARAAERLPMRNLLIEVRQGEASRLEAEGAGLSQGAVAIGTEGVSARAGVTFEARSRDAARDTVQQVRVLNGGRAALRIGTSVPVQWLQWAVTPQGPTVVGGTQWVDGGRGFTVQPRWPGGDAPVTLEVSTESSGPLPSSGGAPSAYGGAPQAPGPVGQATMLTTVQLMLGEWVTVASSGEETRSSERGVISTRSRSSGQRHVVQMRVTAP